MGLEVLVDLGIVDHLTEEKDPFAGVFFYGPESDLNSIFHTIAKAKMPGQPDPQRPKIKQGGAEIFFHFIQFLPLFLDRTDQRAPVNDGDLETFHGGKGTKVGSPATGVCRQRMLLNLQTAFNCQSRKI